MIEQGQVWLFVLAKKETIVCVLETLPTYAKVVILSSLLNMHEPGSLAFIDNSLFNTTGSRLF